MKLINFVRSIFKRFFTSSDDRQLMLLAKILINQHQQSKLMNSLQAAEFKVFSQFGDDGIIQYLINHLLIHPQEHQFVEIGVEDYREANTRFLLLNNHWRGLIVEGDQQYLPKIKSQPIYWQNDLTAISLFVTKNNLLRTLKRLNFHQNIGLLSLDIDGNDYWVLKSIIDVKPIILVVEYNAIFGPHEAVTVPYSKHFNRTAKHFSNLYWGCSLAAIVNLAKQHGYAFVGTNTAGNNAYFAQKSRLQQIKPISITKGFTPAKHRESRDQNHQLTYLNPQQGLALISSLPVLNLKNNRFQKIADLTLLK